MRRLRRRAARRRVQVREPERGSHLRLRLVVLRLSFRHLIFDLDGTLVDSARDLAWAANRMLTDLDLEPQPQATLVGFVGNGVRRLVARAVAAAGGATDDAFVDRALQLFLASYGAHLLETTVPYPGILDALGRLRAAGAVLSIATNKPRGLAVALGEGLGFARDFVAILGGDSLPTHKPDPAIVHALIARVGVPRASTVLVGDSPVDVATARAAGVAVCAVTWGFTPPDALLATRPDFSVDRPEELLRLLA